MTCRKAYSNSAPIWSKYLILTRNLILIIFLFLFINPAKVFGQEEYDEISVFIDIQRVGGGEIDAVIKAQELFLPVTSLFDFLKIRNTPTPDLESISGFFINPDATYVIKRSENKIIYLDKSYILEEGDLIRTESNLYLRSSYFGKVFGLECNFNFRSLSVSVNSKLELPLIREMRQQEIRKNLTRLGGEIIADTTINRTYPLFKSGMADWTINTTEEVNGKAETMLNLSLGSMIAGGEATASLYYNSSGPFREKQQYYLWRYVNNDFSAFRQVMAGKIASNSISSLYSPVLGIQITNTPTTYRRSFGTYTLSDKTEPGWIVELYVNNILVNYVKADASGFFSFQVPLVYGNSMIKLKYFGPWGEERTAEQNINIPFNFLPVKTLEYTASAGIVEDTLFSRFSRINVNYGLSRRLTVGGGFEYFSRVTSDPAMPFLNASLRITNNLLLSGDYTYGVRARGNLSYRLPSNMQMDLNYTWYDKDQKAINNNYREERKVVLSIPLRIKKFSSFQRLSLYQIVFPAFKYTTADWFISGSFFGVNANLSTYALFIAGNKPYLYSNLSLALRLPGSFVFMPQVQYGYTKYGIISTKMGLEKHLLNHAFLNLSYEHLFNSKTSMAELGFRYDFSFAQTGLSVRHSNKKTTFIQYSRGSLINDRTTRYTGADNRTNVGRGGISVTAFLDINSNKHKDNGEPKVYGLNLRANGGRIEKSERDSTIRILGLEPYTNCFIELDPNSFENVSWALPFKTLNVTVDPNIIKNIEVPITVFGEVTGNVTLDKQGENQGIGRIIVSFFTSHNQPAGKTLTESDGYFSFLGLLPGKYVACVDSRQLRNLRMNVEPDSLKFEIAAGIEGDIADGLDFILKMEPGDSAIEAPVIPSKPVVSKDTTYMIVHEVTQELVTIAEDSYAIQLGAFKRKANAEVMRNNLRKLLEKDVEIVVEGDFYKVRITGLKDQNEVNENLLILRLNGISEVWIISLKGRKQQWILTEKRDSIAGIKETVIDKPLPILNRNLIVQAGAFRSESNATALQEKLKSIIDKPVGIIKENGFYKVRITGFVSRTEMEKLLPSLGVLGLKDIWILPVKIKEEQVPVIQQPVIVPSVIDKPAIEQPDTTAKISDEKKEIPVALEKPVKPGPTISLQAGVYIKRSEALRARRRISSKLNLPVEIVEQWDFYRVIITGFYTRQETYIYYPELAGMGYPSVSIIEKK